jgi:N-acetyl-anhydromuramyl-L-alanine amidase AmpD
MSFTPTYIVLHHSATDPRASAEDIRKVHLERGMDDIGYHYLITPEGTILEGRPVSIIGAHARGLNQHSIGVCCIGDYSFEQPSMAMLSSLKQIVSSLKLRFAISPECIIGHRDVIRMTPDATPTACPGDALYAHLADLRDACVA